MKKLLNLSIPASVFMVSLVLFFIIGCVNSSGKNKDSQITGDFIVGYWETIEHINGDSINKTFCQFTEEYFQNYYYGVGFPPAYKYLVTSRDSFFFTEVQDRPLDDTTFVGVIKIISDSVFHLNLPENKQTVFRRSSLADFQRQNEDVIWPEYMY